MEFDLSGFGLLVGQKKSPENVTLGSRKKIFTIFFTFCRLKD